VVNCESRAGFSESGGIVTRSLPPLPSRTTNLAAPEPEVQDAPAQALPEPQAGAVHERRHQPRVAVELREDGLDLIAREHHGQPPGFAGADHVGELPDLAADDVTGEEEERGERRTQRQ
jgi:hypothetical protein